MKAATATLLALILVACDGDRSTTTDGTSAADGARLSGKAVANPAPALPPVVSGRGRQEEGMALGVAASAMDRSEGAGATTTRGQAGPASDPLQNVNAATSAPAMIIRTGQAFIEVKDVDAAVLRVRQLAAQVSGYVTSSSMSGGREQIRQATLEIKVPSTKYDEAVSSLSDIGKVETVNTNAQDVGEEFVDVTARVNNARRLEERLITLLSNRTGRLDEVLRVERELARVREEIERYEGRLRYLTSRVALSTLTITVHEPSPLLGRNPGNNPIIAALRRAWRNFVGLVAAVIASLGILIPLAVLVAAGWLAYKRWIKPRISG